MTVEDYVDEVRTRLDNPAVSDHEIKSYVLAAIRDVKKGFYPTDQYDAQVLDTACQLLYSDNKFPEVTGASQGGVSTSMAGMGDNKFRERLAARRSGAWMNNIYGMSGHVC